MEAALSRHDATLGVLGKLGEWRGEVGRARHALGVRVVGAEHQDAVVAVELVDQRHDVVLRIRGRRGRAAGRSSTVVPRAGRPAKVRSGPCPGSCPSA